MEVLVHSGSNLYLHDHRFNFRSSNYFGTMKRILWIPALFFSAGVSAQSLSPQVIASSGGFFSNGSGSLSWTLGETMTETFTGGSNQLTQGFQQPEMVKVKLNIKAFLAGPYNSTTGVMNDGLRSNGLIPLMEPYTGLSYVHVKGGGETIEASVLLTTGSDAIIDWVFLELRNALDDTEVLATRSALVQADGDIVDVDGTSAVEFASRPDSYYISVQHRNHLNIMSFAPVAFGDTPLSVDFSDGSTDTYGIEAQVDIAGTKALWQGDVMDDGAVIYTNANNDRDPILVAIGGSVPTNTVSGYAQSDVNMDGETKYTNANNDRDPILVVIGGSVPTTTRTEQMP